MRTSDPSPDGLGGEPELLFSAQSPTVPSPTHSPHSPEPASAMSTFMPMQPMPANMMSPDDMLRAYAERRAQAGTGGPTLPAPVYTGTSEPSSMRTLYSPTAGAINFSLKRATVGTIGSEYSAYAEEDAYGGTA